MSALDFNHAVRLQAAGRDVNMETLETGQQTFPLEFLSVTGTAIINSYNANLLFVSTALTADSRL